MEATVDKLPADLKPSITCKICKQPMQLLKASPYVAFWVHRGEQLKTCRKIAFRTSFLNLLKQNYALKKEHMKKQVIKNAAANE